jgi:hypothetical protein
LQLELLAFIGKMTYDGIIFFTPAVKARVRKPPGIFIKNGYTITGMEDLTAGESGQAVAEGILSFNRQIGFPTTRA